MRYQSRLPIRRRARARRLLGRLTLAVLGLTAAILALFFILRLDYFAIAQISVSGAPEALAEILEDYLGKQLQGNFFWLLPRKNIFLFPSRWLSEKVLADFPKVGEINFDRQLPNKLFAQINEREPFFTICLKTEDGLLSDQCLLADPTGFIFAQAADTLRLIEILGPFNSIALGKFIFEPQTAALIVDLTQVIKIQQLEVERVVWDGDSRYELETADDWRVIFSADAFSSLPTGQAGLPVTLQRVLSSEVISNRPGGLKTLDYIDLRFGNKIFLKFK